MKHLIEYNKIYESESVSGQEIQQLMESTPEGKDLMGVASMWSFNDRALIINSNSVFLSLEIEKTDTGIWQVYSSRNTGQRFITGDDHNSAEEAFKYCWSYFIEKASEENLEKFYEWLLNPNCPVLGMGLGAQELYRMYMEYEEGFYFPDLTEFKSPEWENLVKALGMKTSVECAQGMLEVDEGDESFNPRTTPAWEFVLTINPLEGSMKELFNTLSTVDKFKRKDDVRIEIEFYPFNTEDIEKRSSYRWAVTGPTKSKKDVEDLMIKGAKEFIKKDGPYNLLINELVLALLENGNPEDPGFFKKMGDSIRNSPKSLRIMSKLKKIAPEVYQSAFPAPDDEIKTGTDLGDYGF